MCYGYDIGALGYSRPRWAVVPTLWILPNLRNYLLPPGYRGVEWTDDGKLVVVYSDDCLDRDTRVTLQTGDRIHAVELVVLPDEKPLFINLCKNYPQ